MGLLAACADVPTTDDVETAESAREGLPPAQALALTDRYGDELADHGMALTDRGGLIDRSDGYDQSEAGTHLALYLEPVGDRDTDAYLDGIVELTELFATDVFERWPELESFDVCQERGDAGEDESPTLSQVELTRETATAIDWETATLADLLAAAEDDDASFVRTFEPLDDHPDLAAAEAEAGIADGWSS